MQTELSVRIRPELDAFRESMNAARRALSLETSNGVVEGVQNSMRALNTQLRSSLNLRDIASGQIAGINAELRQVNTSIITQRFNQSMNSIKESFGGIMATIGSAQQALGKPIKASIDFEESFSSVKKVLDEATDENKLKAGVLKMSVDLGSSTKDLNAILESAGQMGIKGDKNLLKFTETVQKMSVAFDMSANDAGKSMADIQSILGLSMSGLSELGDTINNISNNSTARASDIIDIMKRISGTGKSFGMSAKEIAGIGSSMLSLGMTSEVAGTSLNAVMSKLGAFDKAEGKAKGLDKVFGDWFSKMGIDMDSWIKMRAEKPKEAFDIFISAVSKMDKVQQTKALKDMFGLEHLGKMQTLAGAMDKYKEVMGHALKDSTGSMDQEFQAKASTTAHQLKRLSAQMEVLYINLGDAVLPVINKIITAFTSMLAPIANFAKSHQGATRAIMFTIAGVLGLKAAIIGLTILKPLAMIVFTPLLRAWTLMRYSVLGNIVTLLWHRAVSFLSAAASLAMRAPLLLLSGTFRLLSGQIRLSTLFTRIFGLTSLLGAGLFSAAMKIMRLALITSGIGLLIVGIGVAIYAIVQNWESIKGWFIGFWAGLKARIAGFWDGIRLIFGAIANTLAPIFETLGYLFGAVISSWVEGFYFLKSVFLGVLEWFGISSESLSGIFNAIKETIGGVWDGLLAKVQPVIEYLKAVYEWWKGIFSGMVGGVMKIAGKLGFGVGQEGNPGQEGGKAPPMLGETLKGQDLTGVNSSLNFDYSRLAGVQMGAPKTDNRSINSNNHQTINVYTQSADAGGIAHAIRQAGIGQYSYKDAEE
ncbi:phage tail tape measure protein [Helicobacter felis]|uniref:phage tail tape measure protein n=1 Tax=Helicobacter felis TaxID=214 RepID=UPI000EF66BAC|nr:phage tail tape measure protein [Helicobacter felis]